MIEKQKELDYKIINFPFTDREIEGLKKIESAVFESPRDDKWQRLFHHKDVFAVVCCNGADIVAMKIGYQLTDKIFYSWIGGVVPDFRRYNIATKLMELQHGECHKRGYNLIQTKTYNKFKPMLILNLKMGFNIIEATPCENGDSKILLQKSLT